MTQNRTDLLISLALFLLFAAITLPGVWWGAPSFWHPDELAKNVYKMVEGEYRIDPTYFNYPFLPKNVMLLTGKALDRLGYSRYAYIVTVRSMNALLAGLIIVLIYQITRWLGGGRLAGLVAAGMIMTSSEMALNARIAHNDIYLATFTTLAVTFVIQYRVSGKKSWLYASFFTIGLAGSSKYNGLGLAVMPVFMLLYDQREKLKQNAFEIFKTLLVGGGWFLVGFLIGTPQAITQFSIFRQYFSVSMFQHAGFDRQPDTPVGIIGQWAVLGESMGMAAAILFLVSVLYHVILLIRGGRWIVDKGDKRRQGIEVILVALVSLNLPMLMVYNYAARFYLPMMILAAVLVGLFVGDLLEFGAKRKDRLMTTGIGAAVLLVLGLSALRVASVVLLFFNDSRIAASAFIAGLPKKSSVEYTFFPPTVPDRFFSRKHNYPLFFPKSMMEGKPDPSQQGKVNLGESGLQKRETDYLIIDSPTFERFKDPATCEAIPVECSFFKRLRAGETSYQLDRSFAYQLPAVLPQLKPFFLNPKIEIYRLSP